MGFKCAFNFNLRNTKLAGWNTQFWHSASDFTVAKAAAKRLSLPLFQMTGNQTQLISVRISDPDNFRVVQTVPINLTASIPPTDLTDADYVTVSLQLKLVGSNSRKSTVWLGGLPDAIVANGGRYNPVGQHVTAIKAFWGLLASDGWALRGLPIPQAFKDVTAIDQAAGLLTVPAHGFGAVNTVLKIRVRQVKFLTVLNQIWKVTVKDADTLTLAGWTAIAPPAAVNFKSARCSRQIQDYTNIIYTDVDGVPSSKPGAISSHKRGRPTDLLSGRRKTRRL